MGDLVRVSREIGGIAVVSLNRAQRLNALVPELHDDLQDTFRALEADHGTTAVVLTGSGRAFCSGGDLKEMAARPRRDLLGPEERKAARAVERSRLAHAHETIRMLARSRLPLVAAINGPAAGAGLALALLADVRVAGPDAVLAVGFSRVGLPGDSGISVLLSEAIGRPKARVAMLEGADWKASEALAIGLVDEVVDEADLLARAVERARHLSAAGTHAIEAIRSRLFACSELDEALEREIEATLDCQETAVHREALDAFLQGRLRSTTT